MRTVLITSIIASIMLASPSLAQQAAPAPSTETVSGGLLCSTQDELTKMLDGIVAGQASLIDGCGVLQQPASVTATQVGEYHNGPISGFIFKYEVPGDVEYGIQSDNAPPPAPQGPTA